MTFRQLFFIEGRLLGDCPRAFVLVHAEIQQPASALFFCRKCGEVFARCPILHPGGKSTHWQSFAKLCRKCSGDSTEVPGSLWLSWDKEFLGALPMPVLQWELERHLDFYASHEKESDNEHTS